ncbi:hypothetical protein OG819_33750 [Streptomyces sp. NBC_01549]|uniref:hypothetical protein n=1 Tax=Streptomyces sp. NBC_01549 TaxID=2975874 RepID=UPI002256E2F7|nr:hypothetical protein [Streptomyces sp. NBC_01549]MCX4594535.1 hypothetical protein [Streptomyces sp. NBC_01549]
MTRVLLELGAEPMLLRGVTVLDFSPVEPLAAGWGGSREARADSRSTHRARAIPTPLSVAARMVRS